MERKYLCVIPVAKLNNGARGELIKVVGATKDQKGYKILRQDVDLHIMHVIDKRNQIYHPHFSEIYFFMPLFRNVIPNNLG